MARGDERQTTDIGYININYDREKKIWTVGGNFTDQAGKQFDLGYVKCGTQGLVEAIAFVGKQMHPTINGKGIERESRNNGGQNNTSGQKSGGGQNNTNGY